MTYAYNTGSPLSIDVDDTTLYIGTTEGLRRFNLRTGNSIGRLRFNSVYNVLVNGTTLFAYHQEMRLQRWDNATSVWQSDRVSNFRRVAVYNGSSLITGDNIGIIQMFDLVSKSRTMQLAPNPTEPAQRVSGILVNNGDLFVQATEKQVKRWNLRSGNVTTIYNTNAHLRCILVEGSRVYAGSDDGRIHIWSIDGALNTILSPYPRAIGINSLITVQGHFFSASDGADIIQWTMSGNALKTIWGHQLSVKWMAGSESRGTIFTGSDDGTVKQFRISDAVVLSSFDVSGQVICVVVSEPFVFATFGTSIAQWHIDSGIQIRSFTAHVAAIHSIALLDDLVFSVSSDGTVKEWLFPELTNSSLFEVPVMATSRRTSSPSTSRQRTSLSSDIVDQEAPDNNPVVAVSSINVGVIISVLAGVIALLGGFVLYSEVQRRSAKEKAENDREARREAKRRKKQERHGRFDENLVPTIIRSEGTVMQTIVQPLSSTYHSTQTEASAPGSEVAIPAFMEMRINTDFVQNAYIAKGANGKVYHGTPVSSELLRRCGDTPIAIKIMDKSIETMKERNRDGFFQELSLLYRFQDQPNFPRLYGYTTRPVALIIKYYQYSDLRAYILLGEPAAKVFPYSKFAVIHILRQLAEAIAYMHQSGVVHSDLKPANVMMDFKFKPNFDVVPVITDFGLSRIVDADMRVVSGFRPSQIRGNSVAYSSPEVIQMFRQFGLDLPGQIAKCADVYAFAIIIYQMMTRNRPWV